MYISTYFGCSLNMSPFWTNTVGIRAKVTCSHLLCLPDSRHLNSPLHMDLFSTLIVASFLVSSFAGV
jgi:hypothetical protein